MQSESTPTAPQSLSSRLSRQMKRHLGVQDGWAGIEKLLHKVKANETLSEDEGKFLTGFHDFLISIDSSYQEGDEKNRMAVRNLEISSEELNTVNARLAELYQRINAMLDGLGQGLLFFDKDGRCSDVFSKACLDIFGTNPSGQFLKDILSLSQEQCDDLEMWLSVIFDSSIPMDFDDLKKLAPQHYTNNNHRYIELDYRPLHISGDAVEGILCIATDRTFEIQAKEELRRKEEEALRIRTISSNRNEFQRYLSSFDEYLDFLDSQKDRLSDMATLIMHLHNFKGTSAVFHFDDLVRTIHRMENMVKSENFDEFISDMTLSLPYIREQKEKAVEIGKLLFGESFLDSRSIITMGFDKLNAFRDILKNENAPLLKTFDTMFLTEAVTTSLKTFRMELERVIASQNKPELVFTIDGGDMLILPKPYSAFFDSLTHLARNIVDHGIEPEDERASKGKPRNGKVTVIINKTGNDRLHLSIRDDGRGLSFESIRDKLQSTGKYTPSETPEQTIQHIFDSDFTTKSHASILSGRGVGMYAVQQEVQKLGGTVIAKNADSGGAQFDFDLPLFTP